MMEPETPALLRNDCLEVLLGGQQDFISAKWLRHPSSAAFRENNYRLADLLLEYECRRILYDARAILSWSWQTSTG